MEQDGVIKGCLIGHGKNNPLQCLPELPNRPHSYLGLAGLYWAMPAVPPKLAALDSDPLRLAPESMELKLERTKELGLEAVLD